MVVKFKKIIFREDPNIEFYKSTDEFNAYVQANYIDTGKIITWRKEDIIDDYKQVLEIETVYRDQESLDEAFADLQFKQDAKLLTEYSQDRGIRLLDSNVITANS